MGAYLDCRGLACPAPVLQTRNLIERERPDLIQVKVDNAAGRENVFRFMSSQGFQVSVEETGSGPLLTARRSGAQPAALPACQRSPAQKKIMIMMGTDHFGRGDEELGLKLMASFLKTLKEMGPELWRLVLVNSGVKMAVDGAEVLPSLRELEDQGVDILVCGACLTHFGLMGRKRIGQTTNMLDIVTSMQVADEVIDI